MTKTLAAVFAALAVTLPQVTRATATSASNLSFSNLGIEADGATVLLASDWDLLSFADARNGRGDVAQAYVDNLPGGTPLKKAEGDASASYTPGDHSVSTDAKVVPTVPMAQATGQAADNSAVPPGLAVSAPVTANVNLTDCRDQWASGQAQGALFNFFMVTDDTGEATGPVEVTFSVDLSATGTVETGECGLSAVTEQIFSLQIFDALPEVDGAEQDQTPLFYDRLVSCDGPNCRKSSPPPISPLTATRIVEFNTLYYFGIFTDAEVRGQVPAPATLLLALAGVPMMVRTRRRNRLRPGGG